MSTDTATRSPFVTTWEPDDGGPPVTYHHLCSRPGWPSYTAAHAACIADHRQDPDADLLPGPFFWEADAMTNHATGECAFAEGYTDNYAEALSNVLTVWACGPDQDGAWPTRPDHSTFNQRMGLP